MSSEWALFYHLCSSMFWFEPYLCSLAAFLMAVFLALSKKPYRPHISVFYMQMKTLRIWLCIVCLALSAQWM